MIFIIGVTEDLRVVFPGYPMLSAEDIDEGRLAEMILDLFI